MAGNVMALAPMLLVFIFAQRWFVQSLAVDRGQGLANGEGRVPVGDEAVRGRHDGGRRARPGGGRRRADGARRAVGVRQVDRASDGGGARAAHLGHDRDRRPRRGGPVAGGARHRDGVPELRPLPAHDRPQEPGVPAPAAPDAAGRRRPEGGRRGRDARADRASRPQARAALRRPAPAGGDGPGAHPRAGGVPPRRAALEPRRQAARRAARRAEAAARTPRDDDDLRHPRPGRGDDAGRPHRGDGPGPAPAGGHARGHLPRAAQHLRGPVRRQPRHEPPAGAGGRSGGRSGRRHPPGAPARRRPRLPAGSRSTCWPRWSSRSGAMSSCTA